MKGTSFGVPEKNHEGIMISHSKIIAYALKNHDR